MNHNYITRTVWVPEWSSHKFVRGQMVSCNRYIKSYQLITQRIYQ